MPDIGLAVTVSRDLLGLPTLDLNDHVSFYIAPGTLGAPMAWQRQQVGAPWVDGLVTVNRTRGMVSEPVVVEVLGDDTAEMFTNQATLIAAFSQDSFTLAVTVNGVANTYRCEAADYQIGSWVSGRLASIQGQITFTMPRQPVHAGVG